MCIANGGTYLGLDTTCAGSTCPAAPTVVGLSTYQQLFDAFSVTRYRVTRAWSDGQIDTMNFTVDTTGCDVLTTCPPVVVVTGTCPTDINRDGDTGIQDFLTLLGGWGACQ